MLCSRKAHYESRAWWQVRLKNSANNVAELAKRHTLPPSVLELLFCRPAMSPSLFPAFISVKGSSEASRRNLGRSWVASANRSPSQSRAYRLQVLYMNMDRTIDLNSKLAFKIQNSNSYSRVNMNAWKVEIMRNWLEVSPFLKSMRSAHARSHSGIGTTES
jgi:hypothetical protein